MKVINNRLYFTFVLIISVKFSLNVYPQNLLQGQWRDHLSYQKCLRIAETPELIYCATESGLISYNTNSNVVRRHSKITGLSDVLVNTIVLCHF